MPIIINANVGSFSTTITSDSSIISSDGMAVSIRAIFSVSQNISISHSIIRVGWEGSGFESGNEYCFLVSHFGVSYKVIIIPTRTSVYLVLTAIYNLDFSRIFSAVIVSGSRLSSG